jgi:hypothetical protein
MSLPARGEILASFPSSFFPLRGETFKPVPSSFGFNVLEDAVIKLSI